MSELAELETVLELAKICRERFDALQERIETIERVLVEERGKRAELERELAELKGGAR